MLESPYRQFNQGNGSEDNIVSIVLGIVSWLALIFLTLSGYSMGVILGRGSGNVDPEPELSDILVMVLIWAGAFLSRVFVLDKWLAVGIWFVVAGIAGFVLSKVFPSSDSSRQVLTQ